MQPEAELVARKHNHPSAAETPESDVGAHASHLPVRAAAGMGLAQSYHVAWREFVFLR